LRRATLQAPKGKKGMKGVAEEEEEEAAVEEEEEADDEVGVWHWHSHG